MIDLKELRRDPERFIRAAADKRIDVDVPRLVELDESLRAKRNEMETLRAEQKRLGKETGREMGRLGGAIKSAAGDERAQLEAELAALEVRPAELKAAIQSIAEEIERLEPEMRALWLQVPQPPDADVPRGMSADDNVELSRWSPDGFDPARPFRESRGFDPLTHIDIVRAHGLVDFERAVKIAGTRHYALCRDGMRLHQAVLRLAFDVMVNEHGFTPVSVPVIVREECMEGTGFFPEGRDQAYHIEESRRGSGHDLFLAGTGEVGLMGFHAEEILDAERLPLRYTTVSTCFRREAGAAGRDTAGLYRIHQFEKVEQVVICRADESESRRWHQEMLGYVQELLRRLELPHRLLQCCTADLGPKNADMIDIECWMPGRGEPGDDGVPPGEWGETHSASRLYDYQCRRLNLRYRGEHGTEFCHSLNNTVLASPRILIPILEMHQQEDGTIRVPGALQPYMNGQDTIGQPITVGAMR